MKKLLFVSLLICTTLISFGQISGSGHDFSGDAWSGGEICIVCHTPHNGNAVPNAPLWNHDNTTATFTLYSSPTMDATVAQPSSNSLLCLSCHDGTVALESFGGATGTNFMSGNALVGIDLSNDHPISFTYNTALATTDDGLADPATANSGLGGTINADLLFSGTLECASCHDVHDNNFGSFLRLDNAGSALCLTCHNK